jgi:sugar fermentation stimulation protein A
VQKLISDSGIYILEFYAKKSFYIEHKKFSGIRFKQGYYYYVGSAQKKLKSRINRHLKRKKKLHWHIDYLSTNTALKISRILQILNLQKNFECQIVQNISANNEIEIIAKNFGNSDCNICSSHLLFSKKKISYNHLFSLYQSTVLFIPSSNEIC